MSWLPAGTVANAKTLSVLRLGRLDYRRALRLQQRLVEARQQDAVGDLLLVVEHPPTVTLGQGGRLEDVRVSPERLAACGIALASTDRGGRATYHGPGQLVVYPIVRLSRGDAHQHLWRLEEAAIQVLADFGVKSNRDPDNPGVWVAGDKVAAVGLAVRGGVAYHGLALNVTPNLAHFASIVPCGIADRGVTSLAQLVSPSPASLTSSVLSATHSPGCVVRSGTSGCKRRPGCARRRRRDRRSTGSTRCCIKHACTPSVRKQPAPTWVNAGRAVRPLSCCWATSARATVASARSPRADLDRQIRASHTAWLARPSRWACATS
jgi:lipoate-protein ligase B